MPKRVLALLLTVAVTVFFLEGCVTLLAKRTQGVTITARPAGARVFVDGNDKGLTPLALRLTKRSPHVIRIEKEGYRAVEIRPRRSKLWFAVIFPNLIWTAFLLPFAGAGEAPLVIPMDPADFRSITWISLLDEGPAVLR